MSSSMDLPPPYPLDLKRAAAWKYVGYPGFSQFMASSNNSFAVRRFEALNVRILLYLQNDIVIKERELQQLDEVSQEPQQDDLETGCGSFMLDAGSTREQLLKDLSVLVKDYNERIVTYFQMQDRPYASEDQRHNLRSWLKHYENAIESSEQTFLEARDLFCPRVPRRTHFGRWMQRLGVSKLVLVDSVGEGSTKYYDWNVWKSFGGFWLVLCTVGALLGPLWAMPSAHSTAHRLAIVSGATVAFSLLATFGTTWKPSQRAMLVAGYFGLMMLMLGLTPAWHDHIGNIEPLHPVGLSTPCPPATPTPSPTATKSSTFSSQTSTNAHPSPTSTSTPRLPEHVSRPSSISSEGYTLSTGAITGITVGSVAGSILMLSVLLYIIRRRRFSRSLTVRSTFDGSKTSDPCPGAVWSYVELP